MADIHDFIFLDIERVRSFVAQASGGVPTERSQQQERDAGGHASAAGGVPFFARIEGQAVYHFVRTATETRSVQDAIFREFVTTCPPSDFSDDPSWSTASALPDGQLVSVGGYIKLVDYRASLEALRSIPKILPAYERFVRATSAPPQGGARPAVAAPKGMPSKAQLDTLSPLIDGMSKLAGADLDNFVRVRVVPAPARPAEAFVGDAPRDAFRYPSSLLTTLYPDGLAEGWRCVGIIHRPVSAKLPASEVHDTMGEMLEWLLDQMRGLTAFRQAARSPEIAFTPLAIYRALRHS